MAAASVLLFSALLVTVTQATVSGDYDTYNNGYTRLLMYFDTGFGGFAYDSSNNHRAVSQTGSSQSSSSNNTGDLGDGQSLYSSGAINTCLSMSASSTVTNLVFGTSPFTIDFWIKPTGYPNASATAMMMGTNTDGFKIYGTQATGVWQVKVRGTSGPTVSFGALTNNVWTHLAVTRTTTNLLTIKDGVMVNSIVWASGNNITSNASSMLFIANSGSSLGCVSGYANEPFQGYLDNIRVTVGTNLYFPPVPHADNIATLTEKTSATTPTTDSTPTAVITSNVAGTVTYGGDCAGSTPTSVGVGDTTVTLKAAGGGGLADGTHANCTAVIAGVTNTLSFTSFLVDATGPTLTEKTAVATPRQGQKPSYTFTASGLRNGEAGTFAVGGGCFTSSTTSLTGTSGTVDKTVILTGPGDTNLADGTYLCTIRATDALGNVGPALTVNSPGGFVVDNVGPTLAATTPVPNPTSSRLPNFTFTTTGLRSGETGFIVRQSGGCYPSPTSFTGTGSPVATTVQLRNASSSGLADGLYSGCTLAVTDEAGNFSGSLVINDFTVDATAPTISEDTAAATPTNDQTPNVTVSVGGLGAGETGTLQFGGSCSSATTSVVGSGNRVLTLTAVGGGNLPAGTYGSCTVRVTDAAGNQSAALTFSPFTVDVTAPVLTQVTAVASPTVDRTPDYAFNSTKAGTAAYGGGCSSSTTAVTAGTNTITFSTLTAGVHASCTVRVTDAAGNQSALLAVSAFTVDAVPVAVADGYALAYGSGPLTVAAAQGVLANDTDADGDALTAGLVTGVTHGTLSLNASGAFTYTPSAGYSGADAFTYRASDGVAVSNTVTAAITVTKTAPTAFTDTFTARTNVVYSPTASLLANDTNTYGEAMTAQLVAGPSHTAGFSLHADGTFSYWSAPGYVGADAFTYRACLGSLCSSPATVTVTVQSAAIFGNATQISVVDNAAPFLDVVIPSDASGTGSVALPASGFTLNEGAARNLYVRGTVSDPNGCADLTGLQLRVFRSGVAGGSACVPDQNDCYAATVSVSQLSACTGAGDGDADFEVALPFANYADPTDAGSPHASETWQVRATVTDGTGLADTLTADFEVLSLAALSVAPEVMDYGTVALGAVSTQQTLTFTNVGNRAVNSYVRADGPMRSSLAGFADIPSVQAHFSVSAAASWATGTPIAATDADLPLDLQQQTADAGPAPVASAYFYMKLPSSGIRGTYTNNLYFTAYAR